MLRWMEGCVIETDADHLRMIGGGTALPNPTRPEDFMESVVLDDK